jgi:hypothetical protein
MSIMRKPYKTSQERRDDALKVGDPIWVFTGSDVFESEVVGLGTVLPGDKAPVFYHVKQRHLNASKEYRLDLYRRPADLEDLIDAVEQAHDELGKSLKKLEEQLADQEEQERCPVCGRILGQPSNEALPESRAARLNTCWSCRG